MYIIVLTASINQGAGIQCVYVYQQQVTVAMAIIYTHDNNYSLWMGEQNSKEA